MSCSGASSSELNYVHNDVHIAVNLYKYADLSFWGRLWYFIKTDPFVFLLGLLYCVICILVAWFSFKEDPLKDYRGGPCDSMHRNRGDSHPFSSISLTFRNLPSVLLAGGLFLSVRAAVTQGETADTIGVAIRRGTARKASETSRRNPEASGRLP